MKSNILKITIASLASGIGMWVLAGLWHQLVLPSVNENVHAHNGTIFIMLSGYLILSFIMSYLFVATYKGEKPIINGLKLGIIIGILWVFPHGLVMAGVHDTSIVYEIKNSIWHMVEQGIGGIIIAYIISRKKQLK